MKEENSFVNQNDNPLTQIKAAATSIVLIQNILATVQILYHKFYLLAAKERFLMVVLLL